MSVTFTVPDAPIVRVPCPFCVESRENGWTGPDENCDEFCRGFMEESTSPEVNLANVNARDIMTLMGFPKDDDLVGSCTAAEMRHGVMRAKHFNRSHLVREPSTTYGDSYVEVAQEGNLLTIHRMVTTATMIDSGRTDEYLLSALERLERLALWAQDNGHNRIFWS